ncbi:carbon storage regulator [Sporanaerobium hydrogeniformans]|uniref:Carbon storage regulator n=1 Tax=Sporanaerobium hydrogeniformans TaxID=3072179 RepID=A0AC61DAX0_9FIRM|nr:carbon storage regulator CsrA [Sporanaerobium hydrogeniformans]PHV69831.1 carbon storage regulator [Sporanaerobium hydrogeniformans]
MLALTRKKDEAIIIDGNIEIKILDVQGDKVKIGISAPKDVSIYREELYNLVKASNEGAHEVTATNKDVLTNLKTLIKK